MLCPVSYYRAFACNDASTCRQVAPEKGEVMSQFQIVNGKLCKLVYAKSIRVNGRTVYPKRAKAFRFWIPV